MFDLIIIGAGPGGIALAAEGAASGLAPSQMLVLEKGPTHNSAIRQLYPEQKLTTANYKGFEARCEGPLCIGDFPAFNSAVPAMKSICTHDLPCTSPPSK